MADFLLNYITLICGAVIFIASGIALLAGRNKLSDNVKIVLLLIVDILIIYFIFIMLAVVSSGSTHHSELAATPASSITGDARTDEVQMDEDRTYEEDGSSLTDGTYTDDTGYSEEN